jgi:hypothetical protein
LVDELKTAKERKIPMPKAKDIACLSLSGQEKFQRLFNILRRTIMALYRKPEIRH